MTLFKLRPLGLGSVAVESFPSFVSRLATVHSLSPNELRALILNRHVGDAACGDEMVRPEYAIPSLVHLVRPTTFTQRLVSDVEIATELKGLFATTFIALGDEFGRQKGVFSDDLAWCPACLEEQAETGQPAHLHLLWSFRDYAVCHLHECELLDRCPQCNSKQSSLKMRCSIDTCIQCGESLAGNGIGLPSKEKSNVYVQDLVGLVGGINANPGQILSQNSARKCVDVLFDEVWRREEEKRLWEMIPRDECIAIVCGEKELTLPVLRRVAYRLGVDLYQILAGRLEPVTMTLDASWLMELPMNLRPRPKRRRICRETLLQRLVLEREKFPEPPPLSGLAKAANTTTGAIEYHFPSFASNVKAAYQRRQHVLRQRKEELGRTLVYEYLATFREVSRKSAQRYLSLKSSLSKNQIRALVSRHVPAAGQIHTVGR